jgi:protein required for attachment to host cells
MTTKSDLTLMEKESLKDYMKFIKEADPNLSDRMRSHYKKQISEILSDEREKNLTFNLLLMIETLKEEKKEAEDQICYLKKR